MGPSKHGRSPRRQHSVLGAMDRRAASRRQSLAAVALCAFAYLYVSPYFPAINNPNENVRLYMTAALVEEGRYAIDGMRRRWGWVNDAARYDGHLYSVKAPGTSWLGVPAYAGFRWLSGGGAAPDRHAALYFCRLVASTLPMLAFFYLLHRFLVRTGASALAREVVFFSVALGSLLYGYSLLFVSHALSAAAAMTALVLLANLLPSRSSQRPAGAIEPAWAGLCTAMVTCLEYPGLPVSLALAGLGIYALWRRPRALTGFVLGGLLPTLVVMHFHWKAFDNPLTPGHLFVETAALRHKHHEGLYGAVGVSGEALFGLLLAPGSGLFPLTPVLLAAVPGFYLTLRDRAVRALGVTALLATLSTVLVIAAMNNWRGGWTIGPRYLAVVVPMLGWAALPALTWLHMSWPRRTALLGMASLTVALVLSGWPSVYYPHLPPEITRPVGQLMPELLAAGLAPRNAGALLGLSGNLSMLPLLLCLAAVLALCVHRAHPKDRPMATLGILVGIAVATALAHPAMASKGEGRRAEGAVRFIMRKWPPPPTAPTAPTAP